MVGPFPISARTQLENPSTTAVARADPTGGDAIEIPRPVKHQRSTTCSIRAVLGVAEVVKDALLPGSVEARGELVDDPATLQTQAIVSDAPSLNRGSVEIPLAVHDGPRHGNLSVVLELGKAVQDVFPPFSIGLLCHLVDRAATARAGCARGTEIPAKFGSTIKVAFRIRNQRADRITAVTTALEEVEYFLLPALRAPCQLENATRSKTKQIPRSVPE